MGVMLSFPFFLCNSGLYSVEVGKCAATHDSLEI